MNLIQNIFDQNPVGKRRSKITALNKEEIIWNHKDKFFKNKKENTML